MRRVIFCLSIFLFCALVASAFSVARAAGPTIAPLSIDAPTTWTKENSPYILKYKLTVKAKLTIEPGVVVKFSSSSIWLDAQAEISAVGTKKEKIVFTSIHDDSAGGNSDTENEKNPQPGDWDRINISPNYPAKFQNAVVSYASTGIKSQSVGPQYENLEIKNSEIKNNYTGIDILNVAPKIESNIISGNDKGIATQLYANYPERIATIRYNSISGNYIGVFANNSFALTPPTVDAKYNWWGKETGPYNRLKNPNGKGDSVTDSWISFDPWLKVDPNVGLDPVVVIPGIMGSWKVDGAWKIDPIFHTYDNLRDEFLANGYEDGKTFFTFPYEWRNSNIDNAKLLRDKISQIKTDTGRPKVDIVAHSMGGLLAREYIESDYYAGDVDQLITVGTPQLGAPKDYVKWEGGGWFYDTYEIVGRTIFDHEAQENNFSDSFDYIRNRPMLSVRELLPIYSYLYDADNNLFRDSYPANYPRNEFLENLNKQENIEQLNKVEFVEIIGKINNPDATVSGFNVTSGFSGDFWKYGVPKNFYNPIFIDNGLRYSDGDKTVPLYSSEASNILADQKIYLNSEHNALPTDAQKYILEILTGKRPDKEINKWHIPNLLLITVHSPVDIQIESPSGEKIGKNFETGGTYDEINGAYYSGFDTNTEFLTIPNPEDGEYKILAEGTGTGEYTIETAKITQDAGAGEAVEATATITGTAEPQVREENKIEIDGDSVKKVEPLTFASKNKEEKNSVETAGIVFGVSQEQNLKKDSENENNADQSQDRISQLDALKGTVRQYFKTNQIKTRKEAAIVAQRLGHIRVHLKNYEILGKKSRLPGKALLGARTKANRHIEGLISRVSRNSPKKINEEARDDLVKKLNDLKIVI